MSVQHPAADQAATAPHPAAEQAVALTVPAAIQADAVTWPVPLGAPPTPSAPAINAVSLSDTTPAVGQVISAIASISGYPSPARTYVWSLDGTPIGGATASTYTPVGGDLDGVLTVAVSATNSEGSAGPVVSAGGTVGGQPAITSATLSNLAPVVGETVTCTVIATGSGTLVTTYQWQLDGSDVGTDSDTYTTTAVGVLTCAVVVSSEYGTDTDTATGSTVGVAPTVDTATLDVATADAGDVVTCTATASGSGTVTLAYQWQLDGSDVSGETASTIDTTGMASGDLTCEVTASSVYGSDMLETTACVLTGVALFAVQYSSGGRELHDGTGHVARDVDGRYVGVSIDDGYAVGDEVGQPAINGLPGATIVGDLAAGLAGDTRLAGFHPTIADYATIPLQAPSWGFLAKTTLSDEHSSVALFSIDANGSGHRALIQRRGVAGIYRSLIGGSTETFITVAPGTEGYLCGSYDYATQTLVTLFVDTSGNIVAQNTNAAAGFIDLTGQTIYMGRHYASNGWERDVGIAAAWVGVVPGIAGLHQMAAAHAAGASRDDLINGTTDAAVVAAVVAAGGTEAAVNAGLAGPYGSVFDGLVSGAYKDAAPGELLEIGAEGDGTPVRVVDPSLPPGIKPAATGRQLFDPNTSSEYATDAEGFYVDSAGNRLTVPAGLVPGDEIRQRLYGLLPAAVLGTIDNGGKRAGLRMESNEAAVIALPDFSHSALVRIRGDVNPYTTGDYQRLVAAADISGDGWEFMIWRGRTEARVYITGDAAVRVTLSGAGVLQEETWYWVGVSVDKATGDVHIYTWEDDGTDYNQETVNVPDLVTADLSGTYYIGNNSSLNSSLDNVQGSHAFGWPTQALTKAQFEASIATINGGGTVDDIDTGGGLATDGVVVADDATQPGDLPYIGAEGDGTPVTVVQP